MGLPLDAASAIPPALAPGQAAEFMDAPLRLQAESYDSFSRRLLQLGGEPGQGDVPARSGVEEELRRLSIDPEIFYGNARRLSRQRFDPDVDEDDEAAGPPGAAPGFSAAGFAAAFAEATGQGMAPEDDEDKREAEGGTWLPGGGVFDPPSRGPAEEEEGPRGATGSGVLGLNMPRHGGEDDEELPFEELVDAGQGETRGGRMGQVTPRGMEGTLQIDSLTDDGDEDDAFRMEVLDADDDAAPEANAEAAEGDAVEAFSLDPEFDYDTVENLTSKVSAKWGEQSQKEEEREREPGPPPDEESHRC